MVITAFQGGGSGKVRARILAGTVCQPHGLVEQGQVLEVSETEYLLLRAAGKAELAPDEPVAEVEQPAVEAEVEARPKRGRR